MLRYKRVCIPGIGTFEIVQQSPQLDVADKTILPPVFITRHFSTDDIPEHQFLFLSALGFGQENLMQELFSFGERLRKRIQNSPFYWKGFGTLQYNATGFSFLPDEIRLDGLQSVTANKVLRENVQHNMLVGDQEMTSRQVTDVLSQVEYKRPWFIIVGWILLLLAIITVVIFLYLNNFQTSSSGLQKRW